MKRTQKTLSILPLLTAAMLWAGPTFAACRTDFIIDNLAEGSAGTDPTGNGTIAYGGLTWHDSFVAGSFGSNVSLNTTVGDTAASYTWQSLVLDPSQDCTYDVDAWWVAASNRTSGAIYKINKTDPSGATTNLVYATANQQVAGSQWNLLGRATFPAGYTGRVRLLSTNAASTKVSADAVRFRLVTDTAPPTVSITHADVSGGSATFQWEGSDDVTPPESLQFKYRLAPLEAAYRPLSLNTSATYSGLAKGAYTLYVKAKDLSGKPSAETTRAITINSSPTCADAIIIDNLAANASGPSGPGTVSVTNGTGTGWTPSIAANAYNAVGTSNASLFPSVSGGTDATYTWTTATLNTEEPCTYAVSVWWTAQGGRTTAAPFEVSGHDGGPTTVTFNQQANGGQWNAHGTYTFAAGSHAAVKMTDAASGKTIADAVQFVLQPNASGNLTLWSMDAALVRGTSQPVNLGAAWAVAALADFNGDAKADLLWVKGQDLTMQLLSDGQKLAETSLTPLNTTQSVMDAGDFNGDGKADIAILDTSSGIITIRPMDGTPGTVSLALTAPATFKAVADFNGDGKADFLMYNPTTNEFSVWVMNGAIRSSTYSISAPPSGYGFRAAADFDGDGKADILFSNASTVIVWLLVDSTATAGSALTNPPGMAIQGVGDYDGDGRADILFKNISTGATTIWFMNGAVVGTSSPSSTAGLELIFQ